MTRSTKTNVNWGNYGIQAITPGVVRNNVVEKMDQTLKSVLRRNDVTAQHKLRFHFWFPITKKTQGHRMGSGAGKFFDMIAPVKAGDIVAEIRTTAPLAVSNCVTNLNERLPFQVRMVAWDYNRSHMKVRKVCPTALAIVRRYKFKFKRSKRVEFMQRLNFVERQRKVSKATILNFLDPMDKKR